MSSLPQLLFCCWVLVGFFYSYTVFNALIFTFRFCILILQMVNWKTEAKGHLIKTHKKFMAKPRNEHNVLLSALFSHCCPLSMRLVLLPPYFHLMWLRMGALVFGLLSSADERPAQCHGHITKMHYTLSLDLPRGLKKPKQENKQQAMRTPSQDLVCHTVGGILSISFTCFLVPLPHS